MKGGNKGVGGGGAGGTALRRPASVLQQIEEAKPEQRLGMLRELFEINPEESVGQEVYDMIHRQSVDGDGRQQDDDITRFFNFIGWTDRLPQTLSEDDWNRQWENDGRPQRYYHSDWPFGGVEATEFARQYFGQTEYRQYVSNGIYGNGTYFASSSAGAAEYGTNMFRGYLNGNAVVGRSRRLDVDAVNYHATHPAFSAMLDRMTGGYGGNDWYAKLSVYAALQGYNVISNGLGYVSVLDRSATTVSTRMSDEGSFIDW